MTIFMDKRLTRTYCDEAGSYVVPNVLSPRDLVFRPDIGQKNCTTIDWDVKPKQTNKSSKMKCVVRFNNCSVILVTTVAGCDRELNFVEE